MRRSTSTQVRTEKKIRNTLFQLSSRNSKEKITVDKIYVVDLFKGWPNAVVDSIFRLAYPRDNQKALHWTSLLTHTS